jgi:hypothetical protein
VTPWIRRRRLIGLVGCGLFAAGSFALAFEGGMPWWAGFFWVACFVGFLLPAQSGFVDEVEISDLGVRRRFGPRLRKKREESVFWEQLTRVEILTTDEGPYTEDFFFLLEGRDGGGVAVSNELAVKHGLVAILQRRLGALDNKAIIEASGSTQVRRFVVWQKHSQPVPGAQVR